MTDLCIVLPHLGAGGAQRVSVLAAEHFASQGLTVSIVTLLPGKSLAHRLPEGVEVIDLGPAVEAKARGDHWNRHFLARLRRYLLINSRRLSGRLLLLLLLPWLERQSHPGARGLADRLLRWSVCAITGPQADLLKLQLECTRPVRVLAMLTRTNILSCLALWDCSAHLVVSERNDPSRQALAPLWRRLRDLLYRRADVVTANTNGVLEAFRDLPGFSDVSLLPNPVPAAMLSGVAEEQVVARQRIGFISLARLVPQKGIDVLLQAMADPALIGCDWSLQVVGDGPERSILEAITERLGLQQRVRFVGFQSNPNPYLASAAVFVLPSRFEGMPNALLEAMAQGLAVVVTDASPGPLEVVEQGVSGLVVPSEDAAALATAMATLAADPDLCERLGAAARQQIKSSDWPQIESTWRAILALP